MIRALWVWLVTGAATLYFGSIAIGASLLRVRGGIYTWATRQWARTILRASNTPVIVHGLENLRRNEPQIVVSNHVSGYDVYALASALPVPFYFVAKKELERIPFFGTAWKAAGHISIDRSNRQKAMQSLQQAGEKIRREKGTVIIFPEGTRSRTGELLEFKKGAFNLAVSAQVPIVPTVVIGSREIVGRRGAIRPRPIHLHFGAPIATEGYTTENMAVLMEQVRSRMLEMLGSPPPALPPQGTGNREQGTGNRELSGASRSDAAPQGTASNGTPPPVSLPPQQSAAPAAPEARRDLQRMRQEGGRGQQWRSS